jgi:hypothetical protein
MLVQGSSASLKRQLFSPGEGKMAIPNTVFANRALEVVSSRQLVQGKASTTRARSHSKPSLPSRIAVIGNYLPRQCGIATFTTDLCSAISAEYGNARLLALPVNDTLEGYDYPARVRWSLARGDFPCGYTMDADGDTLNIYYGAADCAIALARASVRSLLVWLDANAGCDRRQRAADL